jgi:hypothetical protein
MFLFASMQCLLHALPNAREDFIWETITCGCSQKTYFFLDNTLYLFLSQLYAWRAFEAVVSSSRLINQNLIPAKSVRN